ncbi:MAG: agmatine deiminase family protein [bacterium]|nr:agmatine deiminase family protein [bacterium]
MVFSSACAIKDSNPVEETPAANEVEKEYSFPHEGLSHEGTWLQWPHDYTYAGQVESYEPIWVEMTRALVKGENVHLIVYDENEKDRVKNVLEKENVNMDRVDFFVFPYDDVWIRDNGPIFVYDADNKLLLENWEFNGWGNKAPYQKDNLIPTKISEATGIPKIDIDMVMEGGALEFDGNGTCISTLSCVNNNNRTPKFSIKEIEEYITRYYGATNFIWLKGEAGMDITDGHIDGIIKIVDDKTIITTTEFDASHPNFDEDYEDAQILLNAKNINGEAYQFVFLPETKNNVVVVQGESMKGSYMNFYVGNAVVLVPNYDDENDAVANQIIQGIYPDREVVGIEATDLFADGGMIHCVTQQQPVSK